MPKYCGIVSIIMYIEAVGLIILGIHFPVKPEPVFQKPDTQYHWIKGEDEWEIDGCYIEICDGDNT